MTSWRRGECWSKKIFYGKAIIISMDFLKKMVYDGKIISNELTFSFKS